MLLIVPCVRDYWCSYLPCTSWTTDSLWNPGMFQVVLYRQEEPDTGLFGFGHRKFGHWLTSPVKVKQSRCGLLCYFDAVPCIDRQIFQSLLLKSSSSLDSCLLLLLSSVFLRLACGLRELPSKHLINPVCGVVASKWSSHWLKANYPFVLTSAPYYLGMTCVMIFARGFQLVQVLELLNVTRTCWILLKVSCVVVHPI